MLDKMKDLINSKITAMAIKIGDVNKAKHNLEITKSQYRPQLDFLCAIHNMTLMKMEDNDLRGEFTFYLYSILIRYSSN